LVLYDEETVDFVAEFGGEVGEAEGFFWRGGSG